MDVQPHREDAVCLVIRRHGEQMLNWLYWLRPSRAAVMLELLRAQRGRLFDELGDLTVPEDYVNGSSGCPGA